MAIRDLFFSPHKEENSLLESANLFLGVQVSRVLLASPNYTSAKPSQARRSIYAPHSFPQYRGRLDVHKSLSSADIFRLEILPYNAVSRSRELPEWK
jgi:hypothetical protein